MTDTPIRRLVFRLAFPSVLSMLLGSLTNLLGAWYVATLGQNQETKGLAVAAVGVLFSVVALLQTIGFTLGIGGGCLLSRYLGADERERASKIASFSVALSMGLGFLVSVVGFLFFVPILRFLGASEQVFPFAAQYAVFLYLAAPFMTGTVTLSCLWRAQGKTVFSLYGLIVGYLLECLLTPLFLFVFRMGLRGSSLAILLGQSVSFVLFILFYWRKSTEITLSLKRILIPWCEVFAVLSNGMPSLFRQGFSFIANLCLVRVASGYGDAAVSAISASSRVFALFFAVLIGIGQGYQPIVGYHFGQRVYGRIRQAFSFSWKFGSGVAVVLGLLLYFLSPYSMTLLLRDNTQIVSLAVRILRLSAWSLPLVPLSVIVNMSYQAIGKKFSATFLASLRQGILFLPLLYALSEALGLRGIQMVALLSDAIGFALSIPFAVCFLKYLKRKEKCN